MRCAIENTATGYSVSECRPLASGRRVFGLVDRTGWGSGQWDDEPDLVEWEHLGFPCLMVRQRYGGNWCGYVHVPAAHLWSREAYRKNIALNQMEDLWVWRGPADTLHVHGGVIYQGRSKPCEPYPETDGMWVGFDCAHDLDVQPARGGEWNDPRGMYCWEGYVRSEVESLAEQARDADLITPTE